MHITGDGPGSLPVDVRHATDVADSLDELATTLEATCHRLAHERRVLDAWSGPARDLWDDLVDQRLAVCFDLAQRLHASATAILDHVERWHTPAHGDGP